MKAIASSIVVTAGIYGSTVAVAQLPMTLFGIISLAAGLTTLALGLVGWWTSLKYER